MTIKDDLHRLVDYARRLVAEEDDSLSDEGLARTRGRGSPRRRRQCHARGGV